MAYTKTNSLQQAAIVDFVTAAHGNDICNVYACLPSKHPLVVGNRVGQIRRVTDALAYGWDELGHRTRLTPDLRVLQD